MQTFEWIDATSVAQAAQLLAASSSPGEIVVKAGGMDLLDLMKEGLVKPTRVVNLSTIANLSGVTRDSESIRIGALTTLAEIARHPLLTQSYGALAAAAAHAATPQVRNAATLGGNLLQRPRCWYFRNELLHGAEVNDRVRAGENQYHAIFDNDVTPLVHASTPATALVAYGANVHLENARGQTRVVALADFLLPPEATRDRDTALGRDEILTHVTLPVTSPDSRAAYYKQTERDSYDWPICDVAVVLQLKGQRIENASIVQGWVAPVPRRATESERYLQGREPTDATAHEAARLAVRGATPLSRNAYKVALLETVVRRTILTAARAA
jgi:xanthine dehydrogenase YagS FAD-binding subunit